MLSHIQLKNDLKKLGCKLKSQIGGGWAIHEPKGDRVILKTLEEVEQYYLGKTAVAGRPATSVKSIEPQVSQSKALSSSAALVRQASSGINSVTVSASQTSQVTDSKSRAELHAAIDKASQIINLLKERRLKMGINVSHFDLRCNLISKICRAELLEDVMAHAVSVLEEDCRKKLLVKRHFKNHLNEDDVMYFDIKYAGLLV